MMRFQFTFSLKALAGLKTGVLDAANVIASPVAGFLPILSSRCLQVKVPNPKRETGSREARESMTEFRTESTTAAAGF